jgi:C-terminal processing protease CtpA/Prc
LKAGDVIVEVNGGSWLLTPLSSLRDALRSPPGTRIKVKTAGGLEATVVLRDLV